LPSEHPDCGTSNQNRGANVIQQNLRSVNQNAYQEIGSGLYAIRTLLSALRFIRPAIRVAAGCVILYRKSLQALFLRARGFKVAQSE